MRAYSLVTRGRIAAAPKSSRKPLNRRRRRGFRSHRPGRCLDRQGAGRRRQCPPRSAPASRRPRRSSPGHDVAAHQLFLRPRPVAVHGRRSRLHRRRSGRRQHASLGIVQRSAHPLARRQALRARSVGRARPALLALRQRWLDLDLQGARRLVAGRRPALPRRLPARGARADGFGLPGIRKGRAGIPFVHGPVDGQHTLYPGSRHRLAAQLSARPPLGIARGTRPRGNQPDGHALSKEQHETQRQRR